MKKNKIFYSLIILLLISYIYSNEGPLQYPEPALGWEEGDCQSTQIQSPIDIPSIKDESVSIDDGTHAKIKSLSYSDITSGEVKFDNGHKWTTEELDVGYIEIELNQTLYKYKLHSIHFHLYSEHRIENKQYPMEMHMVHKNVDTNDKENENLVLGVLFDYKDDINNEFLEDMNLASEKTINGASITDLIDKDEEYYYYKGSLTTVPCTENVNWIVFKNIRSLSFDQFDEFKDWIENSDLKYYGTGYGNARGPKRLNGRTIYLENYENENSSSFWKYTLIILPVIILLCTIFIYIIINKA